MATHEAASASYADVNTAVGLASAGDTVVVPAGTETWASLLTITDGITLQGDGIGSTVITGNASTNIIEINLDADDLMTITGFELKHTTNDPGKTSVYIDGSGNAWATRVKIHDNKLVKGKRAIHVVGWVEGVAYDNTFENCNIAVGFTGDNNSAWGRTIAPGTEHAFFVEDNTFTINNNSDRNPNQQIYHQEGGRSVVRYNTYDATAFTTGLSNFYDSHGNQDYYSGSGDFRGQPILEVYENNISTYEQNSSRLFGIRGGSLLIYNNTCVATVGTPRINVTEEESWQTSFFSPLDTVWPAEDQLNNTFLWGNTANGSPITSVVLRNANDAEFIQEDRDYFFHAPQSSGGYEYYDDRQGAAGNGADGTLNWNGSHANAYYPYTAYTYPHPLREVGFQQGIKLRFG